MPKPYYKVLGKEGFLWFLDDVVEATNVCGLSRKERLLDVMATRINEIGALLDSDEGASLCARNVGKRSLAPYSASPNPATLP